MQQNIEYHTQTQSIKQMKLLNPINCWSSPLKDKNHAFVDLFDDR